MPGLVQNEEPQLKKRKLRHSDAFSNGQLAVAHDRERNGEPAGASRLFAPFRTVGLVSPTPIPFTAIARGKTTFQITTSVGRSLQTYDLKRGLSLMFITTPQTPGLITASASTSIQVLAAWTYKSKRGVWVFRRGKRVAELELPSGLDEDIVQLLPFGKWLIGCCTTRIEIWNSETLDHHSSLLPPLTKESSQAAILTGGVCTMPTHVNKLFAGRDNGTVEIWNVSSAKIVYRMLPVTANTGPVTTLEPAPSLNLLAIAYMSGLVVIQDVRLDTTLISLGAGVEHRAAITSITFRSDGIGAGNDGRKPGVMATASFVSGDVTLWDLNEGGRRIGTLRAAHNEPSSPGAFDGGITRIEFLPGQAILVSSGADNALRTWIFDATPFSPIPRPLHSRSGHSRPITTLDFLPSDADGADSIGKWILTAAEDRALRGWSLRKDEQNSELSQGAIQKKAKKLDNPDSHAENSSVIQSLKAPDITCMACSLNRDGGMGTLPGNKTLWATAKQLKGQSTATEQNVTGWESIVTGHKDDSRARTWFWGRKRAGRWILETTDGGSVTSCAVSPCGTFAVIGSAKGTVDMYNLQSGLHRQRYPARLTPANARRLELARSQSSNHNREGNVQEPLKHDGPVTGLHVDNMNKYLVSCGKDGKIKFWNFLKGTFEDEINWNSGTPIKYIVCNRSSSLAAVSCGDNCVRLIDLDSRKLVRELTSSNKEINDLCFSNDGRWIVAACNDCTVRTWDIPTGHLIDAFRLHAPCLALSFSSTGEFLATAQGGSVGVDLWSNRTLFGQVSIQPVGEADIIQVEAPTTSGEGGRNFVTAALIDADGNHNFDPTANPDTSIDQLSQGILTLSTVPRSRWQTLLYLDQIRERNKPHEPPKAPKSAPFFLQSLYSGKTDAESVATTSQDIETLENQSQSRIVNFGSTNSTRSDFSALLRKYQQSPDWSAILDELKGLSPAGADIAIRSLDTAAPYDELVAFLDALTQRLREQRDFELIQAWMSVFLRCHSEVVQENASLSKSLGEWREAQRVESQRLNGLVGYCAGVIGFLRGPTS